MYLDSDWIEWKVNQSFQMLQAATTLEKFEAIHFKIINEEY